MMVRPKLSPEEKRSELVVVLLRPTERESLRRLQQPPPNYKSAGSIMREAFLKVHGMTDEDAPEESEELEEWTAVKTTSPTEGD